MNDQQLIYTFEEWEEDYLKKKYKIISLNLLRPTNKNNYK